ncbi:ornithine cyclodeaminase family protein [Caulobacter sp. NIBR2454]|uniref:ornithine cyclodeaminase family protein n=1 Tax=Caulobacter sp. NIBR2454 TaxID=3015996 RepID=UPI0022B6C290|nr:ornithine cyclodeaminase family protein [Caulobacter sp. NIBR2454]
MGATIAGLRVLDAAAVRAALTYEAAIPLVRQAMIALSNGRVRQELRSFIGLGPGRTFAIMPAALDEQAVFGAKLVSVFGDGQGRKAHEGLVVLFNGDDGAPVCLADAGEVTAIRTAAASAAATDALARPGATRLSVLGAGRQARAHIDAIARVRPLSSVTLWGRNFDRAAALAATTTLETGVACVARADARRAVEEADIICTTTAAVDPILQGDWVAPGAHVNLVGSSGPGQAEADSVLVAKGRLVVDHRPHVLAHGGEFLRAKAAGLVDDDVIAAEIGQVFANPALGRTGDDQITVYKSLGHAAQDLACVAWLWGRAG